MAVVISLLRAINLGSHNKVRMEALRKLYEALPLESPQTYLQSGNVVFRTRKKDLAALTVSLENAIKGKFGFAVPVVFRTTDVHPSRLLVTFLAADPGEEARARIRALKIEPEEIRAEHKELYIHYPNGMGRTKLTGAMLERAVKVSGTARNWNTVLKLLEMAERLS